MPDPRFRLSVRQMAGLACIIAGLGVQAVDQGWIKPPGPAPNPDPPPTRLFGFDDLAERTLAAADQVACNQAAANCLAFADAIKFDGRRTTPICGYTSDVVGIFALLNTISWSGSIHLPDAYKSGSAEILARELEPNGEPQELTPEVRALAEEMFRAMSYTLRK